MLTRLTLDYSGEAYTVARIRITDRLMGYRIASPRDSYLLSDNGGCSCPGYRYRGTCKHPVIATMAREAAREARKAGLAVLPSQAITGLVAAFATA